MSIVIVALPGAPKVDPEVAEKDRILNSIIEDRVRSELNPILLQFQLILIIVRSYCLTLI